MRYDAPRYPAVPWLTQSDLQPMGELDGFVDLPGDLTVAMRVPSPFGSGTDAMLAVRAIQTDENGGRITLAITSVVTREAGVTAIHDDIAQMSIQSNPRRVTDDESDVADWGGQDR